MLDWDFIISHTYMFYDAFWLTLQISALGIAWAVIVGFVCALLLSFKPVPILSSLAALYVEVARNTPLLIQLFFLYFGLSKMGLHLSAFWCAIVGVAFLGGGYMCESFRAGLQSVGKTQIESALSIGLSRPHIVRYVVLPQALGVCMPSLAANVIFLIKETSVVGIIALADILYVSKDIIMMYAKTYEALFMLLCAYLIILLPLSFIFSLIESRIKQRL
ncbi:amino acid ABC transporter permease [uncultured Helicobacter sp.]|uniref:amino acid ABC transporter permease n=1 Tax=uncultured Helicobacter sp. TaxID=175537 RepID=UPI00374ED6CF